MGFIQGLFILLATSVASAQSAEISLNVRPTGYGSYILAFEWPSSFGSGRIIDVVGGGDRLLWRFEGPTARLAHEDFSRLGQYQTVKFCLKSDPDAGPLACSAPHEVKWGSWFLRLVKSGHAQRERLPTSVAPEAIPEPEADLSEPPQAEE